MEFCEIVFWRHGECLDTGVLRGKTDSVPDLVSLNAIVKCAAMQPKADVIISSPLNRTLTLAKAMSKQADCPLVVNGGFSEMDFGDWDGKSLNVLWHTEPLEAWWQDPWRISPPNGETMVAFEARVEAALASLLVSRKHGERVWVVTHGGVIRVLMAYILGATRQIGFYNRLDIPYGACVTSRWYRSGASWQGQLVWQSLVHRP